MTNDEAADALAYVYELYYGPLVLILWEFKLRYQHDPSTDELRDFIKSGKLQFQNEFARWTHDHEQSQSNLNSR